MALRDDSFEDLLSKKNELHSVKFHTLRHKLLSTLPTKAKVGDDDDEVQPEHISKENSPNKKV